MAADLSSVKRDAIASLAATLRLHALPFHFNTICLSASFYFIVYTFIGPWLLQNKAPFDYSKLPRTRQILWNDWTASFSQSVINTALAFYVLFYQRATPQTPQERMLGYDSQIQSVVALGFGYFCFHFYQTIKDSHLDGYLMILHALASAVSVGLGFVSSSFTKGDYNQNSSHFPETLCNLLHALVFDLGAS